MTTIRPIQFFGVLLLLVLGAPSLEAAPAQQGTREAVLDSSRQQSSARTGQEDAAQTPRVRRHVYEATLETLVEGRIVRVPARIELTTVAAERAHCEPEADFVACRLERGVDPDLFCWGSGSQRACPRGSVGGLASSIRPSARGRDEPIEALSWSWGRAILNPADDEVSLEYAWFISAESRAIDLISSLEPHAPAAVRADEGTPSEILSLNFTKVEPAGVGTPPEGDGSIRIPLHQMRPGLQLLRVALHRRDLPLCGVTGHFLFGGDCDDHGPDVRPGIRRNEETGGT